MATSDTSDKDSTSNGSHKRRKVCPSIESGGGARDRAHATVHHPKSPHSDNNHDFCAVCYKPSFEGLICCDFCPRVFCQSCLRHSTGEQKREIEDEGKWRCPRCVSGTTERERRDQVLLHRDAFSSLMKGRSLVEFLQLIELRTTRTIFLRVMEVIRPFIDLPRVDAMGPAALNSLNFQLALVQLCHVLGKDTFKELYQEIQESTDINFFFGTRASEAERHKCDQCGKFRVLRTVCLHCGKPFDAITYIHKHLHTYHLRPKYYPELCKELKAEASPDVRKKLDKGEIKIASLVDAAKDDAIGRFLDFFEKQCLTAEPEKDKEDKGFKEWDAKKKMLFHEKGGDMIFLARNLAYVAPPQWKDKCFGMLHKLSLKWMGDNQGLEDLIDDRQFGDFLEGFHTINQLGVQRVEFNSSRGHRGKKTRSERDASGESDGNNSSSSSSPPPSPIKEKRKTRSMGAGGRRNVPAFDLNELKSELLLRGNGIDVVETLGADFSNQADLPIAGSYHCGHCGYEHHPKTRNFTGELCKKCGCALRPRVDWGILLDSIVWAHIARELDMDLIFQRGQSVKIEDVLRHIPTVRQKYKTFDVLGNHCFRLQGFFLTHFLYCMSNWGIHSLRKELFIEEFEFLVANLQASIHTKDAELVGEFIQCLKIFGLTPKTDPEFEPFLNEAIAYLILEGRKLRRAGASISTSDCEDKRYTKYHAAYCAAIGLMDYPYNNKRAGEVEEEEEHIPTLFKRKLSREDLAPPLHPYIKRKREQGLWMM